MKILTLIIKQIYFDQIIAGKKRIETREVLPSTEKKYVVIDEDNAITDLIKYDAIRFYVGYNKNRDTCLVEVKGASLTEYYHEKTNEPVFLTQNGIEYLRLDIVYKLGKVLSLNDI